MSYAAALVRFNTGEISELMSGRIDTEEYKGACRILKNFIPSVQGPVSRRGGTRFVAAAKYHDKNHGFFLFSFPRRSHICWNSETNMFVFFITDSRLSMQAARR